MGSDELNIKARYAPFESTREYTKARGGDADAKRKAPSALINLSKVS